MLRISLLFLAVFLRAITRRKMDIFAVWNLHWLREGTEHLGGVSYGSVAYNRSPYTYADSLVRKISSLRYNSGPKARVSPPLPS
jgi:hypothetical protein